MILVLIEVPEALHCTTVRIHRISREQDCPEQEFTNMSPWKSVLSWKKVCSPANLDNGNLSPIVLSHLSFYNFSSLLWSLVSLAC